MARCASKAHSYLKDHQVWMRDVFERKESGSGSDALIVPITCAHFEQLFQAPYELKRLVSQVRPAKLGLALFTEQRLLPQDRFSQWLPTHPASSIG